MNEIIVDLRHRLHAYPELSGVEHNTAKTIATFIQEHHNTTIIHGTLSTGFAAIYTYSNDGPTVMIRCELDALPIQEVNTMTYQSKVNGVSHKCGHDGHMSMVAGIIFWLKNQSFDSGKVILLFQSAEETGKGAKAVLDDPAFAGLSPDYVFALHNIPGEPMHSVIINDQFSPSVQSFKVSLSGIKSHACEPEKGVNPAITIGQLIASFDSLNVTDKYSDQFALITPVHISMGQVAYGISAGSGEVHYTVRTWTEDAMSDLMSAIKDSVVQICVTHKLTYNISWFDYFPASHNDQKCYNIVRSAAQILGYTIKEQDLPFAFGEDFGWFSKHYPAAMFGLGSGTDQPALHHEEYDFPDGLLPSGTNLFTSIIEQILRGK